jgi:hypothetical protein
MRLTGASANFYGSRKYAVEISSIRVDWIDFDKKGNPMPQGDKSSYSSKQKRQARHIENSEKESGRSTKRAEQIAWATVNKRDGGAKGKKSKRSKSKSR